jgi:hypothetical protein
MNRHRSIEWAEGGLNLPLLSIKQFDSLIKDLSEPEREINGADPLA